MRSATAQLSVDRAAPDIPTKPFLSLCYVILRFLGISLFLSENCRKGMEWNGCVKWGILLLLLLLLQIR